MLDQGHIWSDDLHNRTRFDYVSNNVSYSLYMFINVQAQTETDYLMVSTNTYAGCTQRTSVWNGEYGNCGAWQSEGAKVVNGHKVMSYQANCSTSGAQAYTSEWLLENGNVPFEFVMFSARMYSELDYTNFVLGAGSKNASVFALPARCVAAPTQATSGLPLSPPHPSLAQGGAGSTAERRNVPRAADAAVSDEDVRTLLQEHARSTISYMDRLMFSQAHVLPRLPRV